tara:strand:- start:10022 stop:11071 length:1050 start_codon:yes stop_codon:yes gene_type:complete
MAKSLSYQKLNDLRSISYEIGKRKDLIQASGGNTSCKIDNLLWVKASGKSLVKANEEDIFIALDINKVKNILNCNDNEDVTYPAEIKTHLRASLETALHALMPHKYVVHTHALDVIAHTILFEGQKNLSLLLKDFNWEWVPYKKPGSLLAREVSKIMQNSSPDILILANHGLVVGGEDIKSVELLQQSVLNKVRINPQSFNEFNLDKLNDYITLLNQNGYYAKLPDCEFVHTLATDDWSLTLANMNPLYPDHLVFCGFSPINLSSKVSKEMLCKVASTSKYCIIKDIGVILFKSANQATEDMLEAQAQVHMRIPKGANINTLSDVDCEMLVNCKSEIYRINLQKKILKV